jgi:hypothetical protein
MRYLIIITLLITNLSYGQNNEEGKTITIKLPKINLKTSVSAGFVNPIRDASGDYGWAINAQINKPFLNKYVYVGFNTGYQVNGYYTNRYPKDLNYLQRISTIGGTLGINLFLTKDLSFSLGGIMNASYVKQPNFEGNWNGKIILLDLTIKYPITKKLKLINKIQLGGGELDFFYVSSFYWGSNNIYPASYRTLNFLFGVEF